MEQATIEDLAKDLRDIANNNNPTIPYDLIAGIHKLISAFGGASEVVKFLWDYRRGRKR